MTQERITFPNLKCSSSDMRETKKLLQIYRIFHYTPRKTCLGYAWPFTNPVFCRSIVVAHKPPKILGPVQTLHFKRDRNKERHLLWETDQERRDLESCVLHGVLVQNGEILPSQGRPQIYIWGCQIEEEVYVFSISIFAGYEKHRKANFNAIKNFLIKLS